MLPRWEEASMRLTEGKRIKPLEAEALEAEKLETEVLQKQEEEELGILQYLDQLEQVTARYFSRLVLCYQYGTYKKCSLSLLFFVIFYMLLS